MAYLTELEISQVIPDGTDIQKADYVEKAEAVLDSVTQHFYRFNDIETDVPFRRDQFKKALLSQLKYFNTLGTTDFDEIFNQPESFSVGRTSISGGSDDEGGNSRSPIASDVFMYLEGTGLLYRGVSS